MAKVLELFEPKTEWWRQATSFVKDGLLSEAINLLSKFVDEEVLLQLTSDLSL
jgi:hypothetical protein